MELKETIQIRWIELEIAVAKRNLKQCYILLNEIRDFYHQLNDHKKLPIIKM